MMHHPKFSWMIIKKSHKKIIISRKIIEKNSILKMNQGKKNYLVLRVKLLNF
jgi:hypothetical protein